MKRVWVSRGASSPGSLGRLSQPGASAVQRRLNRAPHRATTSLCGLRQTEGVFLAGEPRDHRRSLVKLQKAAARNFPQHVLYVLRRLLHRTRRSGNRGSHAVHRDIELRNLLAERLGHRNDRCLGGAIGCCVRIPLLARDGPPYRVPVDVQITTSHANADFDREDIDISIYSWAAPPSGPGYRRVLSEIVLPVCAPSLLERAPPLRKPADLANHVLLCSLNRPSDWPTWVAAAQVDHIDGNRGLKFENAALAYQAAIDGLGIMIAQWAFVEDDLSTGRLVAQFELRAPTKRAYFLATHPDREKPARLRAFEEWILSEAPSSNIGSRRQWPETRDNERRRHGWGGIRTHETVARLPVFKTGALNRSATHPALI